MRKNISHILSRFFSRKILFLSVSLALLFSMVHMQPTQAISIKDVLLCMAGGPIAIPTCIVGNVPGLGGILGGAVLNGIAGAVDLVVGVIAAIVKTIAELVSAGMIKAINAFMDIPISPGNPGTPTAIKE